MSVSLSNFRVTYSYCGDVSSCIIIAEDKDDARAIFINEQRSGTKVISVDLA